MIHYRTPSNSANACRTCSTLVSSKLPQIRLGHKRPHPQFNLAATTASYDTARGLAHTLLDVLAAYATMTKAIIMLARELKKGLATGGSGKDGVWTISARVARCSSKSSARPSREIRVAS